jgi:hypothetical protein
MEMKIQMMGGYRLPCGHIRLTRTFVGYVASTAIEWYGGLTQDYKIPGYREQPKDSIFSKISDMIYSDSFGKEAISHVIQLERITCGRMDLCRLIEHPCDYTIEYFDIVDAINEMVYEE